MASGAPQRVCRVGAPLGEGPVWIAQDNALWFVCIKSHKLHRFDPPSGGLNSWDAGAQIGWVLPRRSGGFVVGLQTGLHGFDPVSGRFAPLATVEPHLPGNRLNDATTDGEGRLWFGSMDDSEAEHSGRLYRFDGAMMQDTGLEPVTITNGPAFAPDGRTLYHTDTLGRTIHAVPVNDDGSLGAPRVFATIEDGAGYPDGPVVDSEGSLWTGLFGGWGVRRYASDGRLIETVRFPVANVTKIAFGGADLRTAYATTARKGLSDAELATQSEAGDLFAFAVDVPGQPVVEAAF